MHFKFLYLCAPTHLNVIVNYEILQNKNVYLIIYLKAKVNFQQTYFISFIAKIFCYVLKKLIFLKIKPYKIVVVHLV